jgi:hypothetical protein
MSRKVLSVAGEVLLDLVRERAPPCARRFLRLLGLQLL